MTNPVVGLANPGAVGPEIVLWVFACLALVVEWIRPRRLQPGESLYELLSAEVVTWLGLLLALALVAYRVFSGRIGGEAYYGAIVEDPLATLYRFLCIASSLGIVVAARGYMRQFVNRPEFYALLLLATSAMTFMVMSNDLIMLFLSIEFLSITSYVLVGYLKNSRRSTEASIKYFLFGAICSSLMLYGMSLLYGVTGSTHFEFIEGHLHSGVSILSPALYLLIVVTFFAGIGFKISMWPFHMWAPDAYEGAPTPVTAFLAVGPKLAGIAVFVRVVETLFRPEQYWPLVLGIAAMVTMTWGNLAALNQTNVKRLLAYSSIAQAGYLLVGVVSLAVAGPGAAAIDYYGGGVTPHLSGALPYAAPAVLVYSVAYLIMNLGAFIVVIQVERATGTSDIEGFAGLGEHSPATAASMTVFMLALAGIPLTAGFIGKLYLFGSAVAAANYGAIPLYWALAGFGVANSVVSVFYYFKVVQPIWTRTSPVNNAPPEKELVGLVVVLALLTVFFGIYGQGVIAPAVNYERVYHGPTIPTPDAAASESENGG